MKLTKNELIYIDDKITFRDIWDGEENDLLKIEETFRPIIGSAMIGVSEDFIYKVSKALLDCIDNNKKETEVEFNLYEISLIREIAVSSAKIGEELVGINLKIKVMREIVKHEEEDDEDDGEDKKEEIDIDAINVKEVRKRSKKEIEILINEWRQNDNSN